jgi:putative CocE/NonD family hydrolase
VLTITGACDGDQLGALAHYREHLKHNPEATHYLVIGPWDHAGTRTPKRQFYGLQVGPASLVDLPDLHAQWYAWILQDGAKPAFLQDKVAYYVMGAEKWRYAETLAAVTSREQPLYLQSDGNPTDVFRSGSLTAAPPTASGPDCYIYDPGDTSLGELECAVGPRTRTDQRLMHASIGKQLFYHSATFDQDTEITGFFRLSVWLAIDQADTDFHVAIYEIAPDGTAIQLSHDIMRARYRESFREAKLIRTTAALRYDFERFMFVSKRLGAGARLRLVIGPINSIYSQKNHNGGGAVADESHRDAKVVTVRLFHDDSHPSVLHIPIGQPDPVEQS